MIIGADGVHSVIRETLEKHHITNTKRLNLEWGYKSLSMPPSHPGLRSLGNETFHIWPRERCALLAIPNIDGSFVFTIVLPMDGPVSFSQIKSDQDIRTFFMEQFSDVSSLVPLLTEHFKKNTQGHFQSVYTSSCNPLVFVSPASKFASALWTLVQ